MTEEQKKQIAAFRFGVICELVNGARPSSGEQARLIRDKCARKWQIPYSEKTRISRETIWRWVRCYRASNGKLESLYPQDRSDRGKSRVLDEETALGLIRLRQEMPRATIATLIKQMQARGISNPATVASASTVYRLLARAPADASQGGSGPPQVRGRVRQRPVAERCDARPAGAAGGKRRKAYLIAIIDDHSRLITHAEFYLNERLSSYVDCLKQALVHPRAAAKTLCGQRLGLPLPAAGAYLRLRWALR